MKLRHQYRLNEIMFRFLFSAPTLFVLGFAAGVAYEHNFPGFVSNLISVFIFIASGFGPFIDAILSGI